MAFSVSALICGSPDGASTYVRNMPMRAPRKPAPVQVLRIGLRNVALGAPGERIFRVNPGNHVQHPGSVFDGARDRTAHVRAEEQRHDAVAAGEPEGWTNTDQRVVRGRPADRVSGIRTQAHGAEVRGHRRGGSAARACGNIVEVVGIASDAGNGAHREVGTESPFGHVRFGQDDGAGRAQALNHEGVGRRHESLQSQ